MHRPPPPLVALVCGRVAKQYFELPESGGGDGTVLLNSADLRRCNGSTAVFDRRNGIPNRYFPVEHGALPRDDRVIRFAAAFFATGTRPPLLPCGGAPSGRGAAASAPAQGDAELGSSEPTLAAGIQVEVVGPAEGGVRSFTGEALGHLGPDGEFLDELEGGRVELIPAATDRLGTSVFLLDEPGLYGAELTVTGADPVRLRVRRYEKGSLAGSDT